MAVSKLSRPRNGFEEVAQELRSSLDAFNKSAEGSPAVAQGA